MPDCQSIEADELAILATIIAIALSKSLTLEQTNVIGNFLVAIGSVMLTIAAQEEALKTKNNDQDTDTKKQLQEMQEQLKQLLKGTKSETAESQ